MSARGGGLMAPTLPQVNLLPPEVHAKRGLARLKVWLLVAVLIALLVAAGAVVWSVFTLEGAKDELAVEQETTARLEAEQLRYAEVPVLLGQLAQLSEAREVGMSTEVMWREHVAAIAATAPEGVAIETLTVTVATPTAPFPAPADAIAQPSIANIAFTAESRTVPDTAAWLDGLASIPGFSDAWFSTTVIAGGGDQVFYTVSATVQVTDKALAQRFAAETTEGEN